MKKLLVIFFLTGSAKVFVQENTAIGKEIVSSDGIIYEEADQSDSYNLNTNGTNIFTNNTIPFVNICDLNPN
jgi:hypothetical protein